MTYNDSSDMLCRQRYMSRSRMIQSDNSIKSFYINRLMSIMDVRSLMECIGRSTCINQDPELGGTGGSFERGGNVGRGANRLFTKKPRPRMTMKPPIPRP